jgi:hypothetical protein
MKRWEVAVQKGMLGRMKMEEGNVAGRAAGIAAADPWHVISRQHMQM